MTTIYSDTAITSAAGPAPGDFVRVRGRVWIVEAVREDRPGVVGLICVDDDAQGDELEVDLEAEIDVKPLGDEWSALASSPSDAKMLSALLQVTRWNTASAADRRLFQAPFRAGIRLDSYQLAPLEKALGLPRINLLIADDVGLGKTVEAGLIARELLLRRRIDMIIIVAPASTLLQWQDEMEQKFGLPVSIVDRDHILATRRARGYGANPFSIGATFAMSHDAASNETYAAPLRGHVGEFRPRSLLIVDEAHHVAPSGGGSYAVESQLTRSIRDLADRFEHRLFLTATPHNGHSNAFATLLEILDPQRFTRGIPVEPGDLEPIMVRRLKEDLRRLGEPFPRRDVAPIVIDGLPASAPELRLAGMVADMNRAGGAHGGFARAMLQQRLFSSIAAFHGAASTYRKTILRRSTAVADAVEDRELDDLRSLGRGGARAGEIRDLEAMLDLAAETMAAPDARIAWLLDWLEANALDGTEWRDRRLIVFTEWEATRRWIETCLMQALAARGVDAKGRIESFTGASGDRRARDAVARAFNAPFDEAPVRILLCTDAAREGINLQARCCDLIHFDLPWNPSRLEQRNGRIDRKLQPAEVVRCRYFVFAQRAEDRVLEALVRKSETIREELGAAGEVLRSELHDRLAGSGIDPAEVDTEVAFIEKITGSEVARREVGDDGRREAVGREIERLRDMQERARTRVGIDSPDLERVFRLGLGAAGLDLVDAAEAGLPGAQRLAFATPVQEREWETVRDDLRPGRPPKGRELAKWRRETQPRAFVFGPPDIQPSTPEPQGVVQLHLEHRLVRRVLGRFIARGTQDRVDRVAAVTGPGAQPRVVLVGRLSLYGPAGRRLHEELIFVTARWKDHASGGPTVFGTQGETVTLHQLDAALRRGQNVPHGISEMLSVRVEDDLAILKEAFEARAADAQEIAARDLARIGDNEADALVGLIRRQIARVEREKATADPPQAVLDLRTDEERARDERERRQREEDRRSWDAKAERLATALNQEPARVREGYAIAAARREPVGLIYLWPER